MKRRLLLNVVIRESAAILKLLASEDEALLVRGDTASTLSALCPSSRAARKNSPLLILNLGLHIVDGVGRLHLKGDRLPRKGLDENLHRSLPELFDTLLGGVS